MSTSSSTELLGRPIYGEINRYSDRDDVEQRPIAELIEKLDALLAFPEVTAIRWEQYTPYFNDGEACYFSIYTEGEMLYSDSDQWSDDGGKRWPPNYFESHAYHKYNYSTHQSEVPAGFLPVEWDDLKVHVNGVERPDIEQAHDAFVEALNSGAYNVELNKHFGDPARVTATRTGFEVEFYDHD